MNIAEDQRQCAEARIDSGYDQRRRVMLNSCDQPRHNQKDGIARHTDERWSGTTVEGLAESTMLHPDLGDVAVDETVVGEQAKLEEEEQAKSQCGGSPDNKEPAITAYEILER